MFSFVPAVRFRHRKTHGWLPPLLALLLCLCSPLTRAGTPPSLTLDGAPDSLSLATHLRHHIDSSGQQTLADVQALADADWQGNPQGTINFRQSSAPFWFHVRLDALPTAREARWLHVNYPHLDQLDVYLVRNGSPLRAFHTGDTRPFSTRPEPRRTYLFPLDELKEGPLDLYVRAASQGPMMTPFDLTTRAALDSQDKSLNLWIGAYFGIMVVMMLYNGLIFLFVRDLSYFLYLIYIGCTALLQFTLYGFGFEFLWPESVSLNNTMILALTALMPFSAVTFVWRFIGLGELGHPLEKAVYLVLMAGFGVVLVGAFTLPYMNMLKLAHTLSFLSVSLGFYLGVKYWIRGIKAARIFALAWFVYLIFILYYLLEITGAIQPDFVSQHALEIGSALELILLSLAFADRLNEEKELRLKAQVKLNAELDDLVRARTGELEEANRRLREASITDGLTGLINRRHFDELYALEFQRAYREKQPIAVLMLDVDHFKNINDTYGHPFGDLCLQKVAEAMRLSVRRPPDVAARYGGEEFVVLLPNTDLKGAECVAETIRQNLMALLIDDGRQHITLTASLGVSGQIPGARDQGQALLKQADRCLYDAKHGGRNRVVSAAPTSP